jgi:hypothetical protein
MIENKSFPDDVRVRDGGADMDMMVRQLYMSHFSSTFCDSYPVLLSSLAGVPDSVLSERIWSFCTL